MIEHPPLLHHRPFGLARGAGGIYHIGQVSWLAAWGQVLFILAALGYVLQAHALWTALSGHFREGSLERVRKRPSREHQSALTPLDHLPQSGLWMVRIQR